MTFQSQIVSAFTPIGGAYDDASITRALTWAQSFVETYCDQIFDVVTGDVALIDPTPYRRALLPHVPVISIELVEVFIPPAWQTVTDYEYTADTGTIHAHQWPCTPNGLRVTYTHGYETAPQAVVDVACRLAQQYLENPSSVMQRRVGDMETRFSGSKGMILDDYDAIVLGRYRNIGVS